MRRVLGVTFTGLGSFLIVIAILARFFLPGQVIKFPLNEYTVSRLVGQNVNYFSPATGTELTSATVRAVSTVQGDVSAGSSSVAVWNDITGVFDITNGGSPGAPISYTTERLAFNRRTGVLVNCCGAEIGARRVTMSGQGYVWPIGTQKKTYEVFDTTLLKPEPYQYSGTTTVDGMTVYEFTNHISNQQFSTITVPGSLVGVKDQASLTLPEYLTADYTDYVDPGTGSPVKVIQSFTEWLQDPSTGANVLTLFHGTLTSTPASIQAAVNTARSSDDEISAVQDVGPLVGGLVGLVLLVLGILLLAREREEYDYEDDDEGGGFDQDDHTVGAQA
jgi:hypothetical protein